MEDQSISTAKATEDKPVKKSVAELAGKFKGQAIPSPAGKDVQQNNRVNRRRPPSSLALHDTKKESGQSEEEKGATNASSLSLKVKTKNSPLIEKLQANLALSPNALLPSPKSPGLKLHPSSFPFASPSSTPSSPGVRSHSSEEASASFDKPAEGTVLHNINKGRARLSIKRRPPSRKLRKSSSEEPTGKTPSPSQEQPRQNGEDDVFEAVKVEDPKEDNKPSMKEPEGSVKSSEGDKLQDGPKSKTLGESVEHMGKVSQEKPDRPQETPEACESVEAEHRPSKKAQAETRALDNTPGDIQTAGLSSNNEDTKTGETSKEEEEVKANQEEVKTNQEEEVKTNQEEEVKTNQEEEVKTNQEEEVKTNQEEEVKTNGSDDKDKQPEGDGN
ncbi:capZ-interacting protein-like isoform X1 [Acipenser ruthenus]|uniref:capZ-interacting protein-like isoform X1 n=1 Tax=Acipenser ruthenus TaxID=7906 RepID=UPI0027410C1A|nr:capZ-interacting protein-like isoform X1 [Acipenser ruthenus]